MMRGSTLTLTATLPLPPPINRTMRQAHHRSSPDGVAWTKIALPLLRLAGMKRLPAGHYDYRVIATLYCASQRDIDSSAKIVLDAVKTALDVDDRHCYEYVLRKVTTPPRSKHRLHLEVTVESRP